nr:pickpocket protein 28-like [Danaus plexippus plexippus]
MKRFLWLCMVIISVFGTVILSGTTWSRYQSSPTVVSMDRDMFAWNTTFPCITLCPTKKLDPGKLTAYIGYRAANRWDIVTSKNFTFFVHPLDGEVFAQLNNISSSYEVYIHGPLEVPDISTKRHYADENYYMKIYVTAMTVYTSPEAARLSVGQRRCRFLHENSLKHNSVYTYNMCRMECRLRLCLKYCKCVPFFYRNGKEKICDVDGMQCLAKYKDDLIKLRTKDGKKVSCECLPICDDVNYIVQSHALHEWFLGTFFQWGIVTYPRMRYRRDIIFGFTDVLVAVGGMAGLFLGCSVLSFMEIVYFLTLRLFWYARRG